MFELIPIFDASSVNVITWLALSAEAEALKWNPFKIITVSGAVTDLLMPFNGYNDCLDPIQEFIKSNPLPLALLNSTLLILSCIRPRFSFFDVLDFDCSYWNQFQFYPNLLSFSKYHVARLFEGQNGFSMKRFEFSLVGSDALPSSGFISAFMNDIALMDLHRRIYAPTFNF